MWFPNIKETTIDEMNQEGGGNSPFNEDEIVS